MQAVQESIKRVMSRARLTTASTLQTDACSLCHGRGYVPMPTPDNPRAWGRCECLVREIKQYRFNTLVEKAKMKNMTHRTLEAYKPATERQQTALNLIMKGHDSFYLYGPWGPGKSHLMAGTVWRALKMDIPSVILSVPKLLDAMRREGRDKSVDVMGLAQDIPYLVLDDIGKEKESDWTEERLFMLLDDRCNLWEAGKGHTSFTSQFPLAVLAQKMDGAIIDRIQGMCQVLYLDGDSQRGRRR